MLLTFLEMDKKSYEPCDGNDRKDKTGDDHNHGKGDDPPHDARLVAGTGPIGAMPEGTSREDGVVRFVCEVRTETHRPTNAFHS